MTLFAERLTGLPPLIEATVLTLDHPALVEAAERLGVRLAPPTGRGRRARLTVVS